MSKGVARDPWHRLRDLTAARIAIGRAGGSLPTRELLSFSLDHARARDAVHHALDQRSVQDALARRGLPWLAAHSAAASRADYLRRPDLGRRLDDGSRARLLAAADPGGCDLALVLADGLSAIAVERHAPALLDALLPLLEDWRLAPVVIAEQARVALGDDIGAALRACQVVMLIGERPGLSSPDSLGIYLTHDPQPGRSDADRNCISNVRPQGLAPEIAARRLNHLMRGARALGASGIALKDDFAGDARSLG
ncbi:MAG: ethanolamine ammonia-lyase subunit EutC [Rhodocyclaceae bacterium]|nr:ethanolamine ammonia-lyase subunit EutC [Rhodocyclaceae bacterium]